MSTAVGNAFKRIDTEYRSGSGSLGGHLGGPLAPTARFKASRAYDKVIGLTILVLVSAIAGWAVVPVGAAFGCMIVAFVVIMVAWFRIRWARWLAPVYAVTEGIALGAISGAYATLGSGIVPTAVVFTAAVYLGALVAYRTGLVRVTPRMVTMAMMGAFGIIAVSILSMFIGVPGVNSFGSLGIVFGVLCLAVAVFNLFVDFDFINRSEAMGAPAEAEWAAALAVLSALVLVYLSILRILASVYGGRRR